MNPWLLLAATVAWAASIGGSFFYGQEVGRDALIATQKVVDDAVEKAGRAAQEGAAAEIAKLRPRNVTIRQELEREIQTRVEYRDCRHSPDGLRLINEALTGRPQPAADSDVPPAGTAVR